MTLTDALERSGAVHGPGLLGLVTDGGEMVFEGAVGVADLAEPRPMTADDLVRIGSITKTYVSVLALQLEAEGVFSGTDPVERWLPGLVEDGDRITVEMLLRMRSGLPDYGAEVFGDERDLEPLRRYWSPAELVTEAMATGDRKPPGLVHRYCNTDYILLGMIIERATGERLDVLLWRRTCEPLGLASTVFPIADPYLRMTDGAEDLGSGWSRGIGLVRFGDDTYGHHGRVPGYTTIALRRGARSVVLCQNGMDVANVLMTGNPFVEAALGAGWGRRSS